MFALFVSFYYSMLMGSWNNFHPTDIPKLIQGVLNPLGQLLTSIFNNVDTPISDLGDTISSSFVSWGGNSIYYYQGTIALVLATITSIGIVVMAVKGIKKVFGIFFYGVK